MKESFEAAGSRFSPSSARGHYESWFIRANHPTKPVGFWCRYTIFSPRGHADRATAELWAIWFDGERDGPDEIVALKEDVDLSRSAFAARGLDVRVGEARLTLEHASGSVASASELLGWELHIGAGDGPVPLLANVLYTTPIPKAKSVVLAASVPFTGVFRVGDREERIEGWIGSVNHNWGSQHTDEYAWGQVAGFDGAPDAFLECLTARVAVLPALDLRTPWSTFAVLRWNGKTYALNGVREAFTAKASYRVGEWRFAVRGTAANRGVEVEARIWAPKSAFAGLTYRNPPGGAKVCHNTKIASAEVRLREGGREVWLTAQRRAAFEVLSDEADGVRMFV